MIDTRALLTGTRLWRLLLALGVAARRAATKPPGPPAAASSPVQILPGTSSKEPISIDADKLVYFDKEQKAIYSGNVVVDPGRHEDDLLGDDGLSGPIAAIAGRPRQRRRRRMRKARLRTPGSSQNSGIKRLEAAGPVTVVSKTQVATGDSGIYDKLQDKVFLIGHVTLSDGQNVTKGDKLTYDLKSGQATIDTNGGKAARVHGQFTPANGAEPAKPK